MKEKSRITANHLFWGPPNFVYNDHLPFIIHAIPEANFFLIWIFTNLHRNIRCQSVGMFQLSFKHLVLWTNNLVYPIPALNFWNVLEFPHIYLPPPPSNKKKLDDGIFPKQSRPKIPKLQNKKAAMMLTFPRRGIELKTVFTRTSWMDGWMVS